MYVLRIYNYTDDVALGRFCITGKGIHRPSVVPPGGSPHKWPVKQGSDVFFV